VEFAGIVRDQKNLDALMLLTLADGQGTSADAWSDWKETLVWELYRSTSHYLSDQEAFFEQTKIEREELQARVTENLGAEFAEEVEAHFEVMPDNYFRAFTTDEIVSHLKLFRQFLENLYLRHDAPPPLAPAVGWEAFPEQGHSIVSFCAWDGQELLAKIAGSFLGRSAQHSERRHLHRGDNVVLDVFRVCDPLPRRTANATKSGNDVRSALTDEHAFAPLLEQARRRITATARPRFSHQVTVENKTHHAFTIVQIQARSSWPALVLRRSARKRLDPCHASARKGAAIDRSTSPIAGPARRSPIHLGSRPSSSDCRTPPSANRTSCAPVSV
jgi:[protein-PII] uridylyltransferase